MANAFTTTPAPPGLDGLSPTSLAALNMAALVATNNAKFMADAGETVTYVPNGATGSPGAALTLLAVVDRHPPAVITEDGKVLADFVEVTFLNDAAGGVTTINPGRDQIFVSGRFGGPAGSHLVTLVVKGDAGMWTVRAR